MTDLTPPAWAAAFGTYVKKQQELWNAVRRNQPYLYEQVPCDPAWLAARAEFAERWEAIRAEGFERGFLEEDGCYECAGAVELTTNTTATARHPNPDYVPGPATITIPRAPSTTPSP